MSLPPPVILNLAGLPTSGPEEGLHEINTFWENIWTRSPATAREQELQAMLDAGVVRHRLSSNTWLPAASVLQAKARHMVGTAPGLDGWDAKALALLPEAAFETFRQLVLEWGARQQWPSVWQNIRQVHLRKDDAPTLAPCAAKKHETNRYFLYMVQTPHELLHGSGTRANVDGSCPPTSSSWWHSQPLGCYSLEWDFRPTGPRRRCLGIGLCKMLWLCEPKNCFTSPTSTPVAQRSCITAWTYLASTATFSPIGAMYPERTCYGANLFTTRRSGESSWAFAGLEWCYLWRSLGLPWRQHGNFPGRQSVGFSVYQHSLNRSRGLDPEGLDQWDFWSCYG